MTEHSPGFCECLETPPLFVSNGVERKKTPGNSGDLVGVKMWLFWRLELCLPTGRPKRHDLNHLMMVYCILWHGSDHFPSFSFLNNGWFVGSSCWSSRVYFISIQSWIFRLSVKGSGSVFGGFFAQISQVPLKSSEKTTSGVQKAVKIFRGVSHWSDGNFFAFWKVFHDSNHHLFNCLLSGKIYSRAKSHAGNCDPSTGVQGHQPADAYRPTVYRCFIKRAYGHPVINPRDSGRRPFEACCSHEVQLHYLSSVWVCSQSHLTP